MRAERLTATDEILMASLAMLRRLPEMILFSEVITIAL
jgi:hypothetical protein